MFVMKISAGLAGNREVSGSAVGCLENDAHDPPPGLPWHIAASVSSLSLFTIAGAAIPSGGIFSEFLIICFSGKFSAAQLQSL